tara:strand:+ start:50482 stop:50649 length:168 start_codon:yes stop_codon:yes gene_type:complete
MHSRLLSKSENFKTLNNIKTLALIKIQKENTKVVKYIYEILQSTKNPLGMHKFIF